MIKSINKIYIIIKWVKLKDMTIVNKNTNKYISINLEI